MAHYQSWFRPWLDDPGAWEIWQFGPEEEAEIAALLAEAGRAAAERLVGHYGGQANSFGALALIEKLSAQTAGAEDLFRLALILLAVDHYRAQVAVPRPEPGGGTNPVNRDCWARLRPYLMARLRRCLAANAADSLAARAILGRIADNWIPGPEIARRLEREIMDSGAFVSVEVGLDLKLPVPGGRVWLRAETEKALSAVTALLRKRQPALIEVLRDPTTAPGSAQFLVVYELQAQDDGTVLSCYDPKDATRPRRLRLKALEDRVAFQELPADETRPAVRGFRVLDLPRELPPLSWIRRWLRWVFGFFWYLKRRWRLWADRKRKVSLLPSDDPP